MPDSQDFNPNKDINRYLAQQGRAPQSHFDWETWRKIGQPGAYQAPPGVGSEFRGVRSGAGRPSYSQGGSHYSMFEGLGNTLASVGSGVSSLFGKIGKGSDSRTKSSKGSSMADESGQGNVTSGGNTNRSQNASITSPANSRGMRRGRGNDFNSTLAAHNITMVQGNDNYGTIGGNMGGANVGGGYYDNSFQSKNTGGTQSAYSNNAPVNPVSDSGDGSSWAPPVPSQGATPRPRGPRPSAQPAAQSNMPVPQGPAQISGGTQQTSTAQGTAGAQEPMQGPVAPTSSRGEKVYGLATDQGTTPGERMNAQNKWYGMGYQGPFQSETPNTYGSVSTTPQLTAGVGPQAPVQGPVMQRSTPSTTGTIGNSGPNMVMGQRGVTTEEKDMVDFQRQQQRLPYSPGYAPDYEGLDIGKINPGALAKMPGASRVGINEQGGVGAKAYGPNKKPGYRKASTTPVEGPKSPASKKGSTTPKKKGTK